MYALSFDMNIAELEEHYGYPYKHHTKAELNAMLDEAEARFEAGLGIPHEEVMREMDEEIERWEQEELEMAAQEKGYTVRPVAPDIEKWSGCATFSQEEIDGDPRLKAILSR